MIDISMENEISEFTRIRKKSPGRFKILQNHEISTIFFV